MWLFQIVSYGRFTSCQSNCLRIQNIFLRDTILIHRCLYSGYLKGALLICQRNQIMTSFFIYSMRKGKSFQWNARSCFVEMLLCLAVFHLMKASKETESESHSGLEMKLKFLIHIVRLSPHSEFILSGCISGFVSA